MIREYPVATAQQSLSRLIKNIEPGEHVTLTQRGKVVAVLLTPADYARLTEAQRHPWWEAIEKFREQGDGVDLSDQEVDSWRDRSPPREINL
jgi:prevent-host-death family protein